MWARRGEGERERGQEERRGLTVLWSEVGEAVISRSGGGGWEGVSHKRCLLHAVPLTRQPIPRALYFSSKLFFLLSSLFMPPLHDFSTFIFFIPWRTCSLFTLYVFPSIYIYSPRQEMWVNCWSRDKPGQSLSFNTHYPPSFLPLSFVS